MKQNRSATVHVEFRDELISELRRAGFDVRPAARHRSGDIAGLPDFAITIRDRPNYAALAEVERHALRHGVEFPMVVSRRPGDQDHSVLMSWRTVVAIIDRLNDPAPTPLSATPPVPPPAPTKRLSDFCDECSQPIPKDRSVRSSTCSRRCAQRRSYVRSRAARAARQAEAS